MDKLSEQYTEIVGVTHRHGEEECYDLMPKVAQLEAFKMLVEAAVSVKKQGATLGKQWYEDAREALEATLSKGD